MIGFVNYFEQYSYGQIKSKLVSLVFQLVARILHNEDNFK